MSYWDGFIHGWLLMTVLFLIAAHFDNKYFWRKHRELEAKQAAINRRIDDLAESR